LRHLTADNPAHRRIVTQPIGVVHILVAGHTPQHRLPQQANQRMMATLVNSRVGEHLAGQRGEPKRVIEFTIGEQSVIGGAAKLQRQAAVKIDPESTRFGLTLCVPKT